MSRKWGVLIFILVAALIMTMGPGLTAGWAQPEEEEEPIQAYPWDDGMIFPLSDGTEARISGSRLLLIRGDREMMALDGKYALENGQELVVKGGKAGTVGDDGQHDAIIINDRQRSMGRPGSKVMDDGRHGDGKALLPAVRTIPATRMGSAPGNQRSGSSGLEDDGEHGAIIIVNNRQAVMERGADGRTRLFFLQGGKKIPAANGQYRTSDGRNIMVSGGQAAFSAAPMRGGSPGPAQLPAVQLPAVQKR